MLPTFADDAVAIVHPVWVTDPRNSRRATFPDDAPRVVVEGCSVQPGATAEALEGRDTTTVRWTVYAPEGTPVDSTDAIEYEGVRYAVDGQPAVHRSPTGATSHVAILLVDWK